MSDTIKTHYLSNDAMLKESYVMSAQYETDATVKDILLNKASQIYVQENNGTIHSDNSKTYLMSEVLYELSYEVKPILDLSKVPIYSKAFEMPYSAEREYLLTLVYLNNPANKLWVIEAARHIKNAYSLMPNDPRIQALAFLFQKYLE